MKLTFLSSKDEGQLDAALEIFNGALKLKIITLDGDVEKAIEQTVDSFMEKTEVSRETVEDLFTTLLILLARNMEMK